MTRFTLFHCLFSPRKVLAEVERLKSDNEMLRKSYIELQAADQELVSRMKVVYCPGSTTLLANSHASRLTKGGDV